MSRFDTTGNGRLEPEEEAAAQQQFREGWGGRRGPEL
jgi:hypothetical protein